MFIMPNGWSWRITTSPFHDLAYMCFVPTVFYWWKILHSTALQAGIQIFSFGLRKSRQTTKTAVSMAQCYFLRGGNVSRKGPKTVIYYNLQFYLQLRNKMLAVHLRSRWMDESSSVVPREKKWSSWHLLLAFQAGFFQEVFHRGLVVFSWYLQSNTHSLLFEVVFL